MTVLCGKIAVNNFYLRLKFSERNIFQMLSFFWNNKSEILIYNND
jgi:hypothetical protein